MKILIVVLICIISAGYLKAAEIDSIAHPEEIINNDNIVVWTPLFQAAWDDLHRGLGTPEKIIPPNELMTRLDHFEWKVKEVMPATQWKVWSGNATQELIDLANAEARAMTNDINTMFNIEPRPNSQIALGFLNRNVVFKKPLSRSLKLPLEFQEPDGNVQQVKFFGTILKPYDSNDEVSVLAYQTGSYALQIASIADDSAVLYLPENPESFSDACTKLREMRSSKLSGEPGALQDPKLHENDDVRIPLLKMKTTANFAPILDSARYFKDSEVPWKIFKAEQHINFELTEKGAKLRVKVESVADPFGSPLPQPSMIKRLFYFDRPFFVFLWREGANWPYFGAWIGNSTTMEKFDER